MNVIRCADPEEVAWRAADAIATAVAAARVTKGVAHLCLTGGSTPRRCYELLGPLLDSWEDVHLWYGDERCVPHDDPESNAGMVHLALLARGAVEHPIPGELGPWQGAAAYAQELGDTVMDLTLNGMGPDGHTASLFPGFPQLAATGVAVCVRDSPKPPPERVTLTLGKLNEARRILLLVTGAEKAPILARVLAGPDPDLPASLLARDRLEVIADAAALPGA
jgi:6-phosphogluconolactonase